MKLSFPAGLGDLDIGFGSGIAFTLDELGRSPVCNPFASPAWCAAGAVLALVVLFIAPV